MKPTAVFGHADSKNRLHTQFDGGFIQRIGEVIISFSALKINARAFFVVQSPQRRH